MVVEKREEEVGIPRFDPSIHWIGQMARGDDAALRALYARYNRVFFGILLRSLNNRAEAEEALQDLFTRAWNKSGSYDPKRATPFTWLAMMARSIAIDRLRRQRRRPGHDPLEEAGPFAPPDESSAEDRLDARDDGRELRHLLDCLSPHQRKSIDLAYFKGFSHSEIAAKLERPLGSVKSDIRRGLLRLRAIIRKREIFPES